MPNKPTESGVSAVELVIIVPIVFAGLALMQFGWSVTSCRADVRFAANQAARAAARAQTRAGAQSAAFQAAQAVVADRQIPCQAPIRVMVKSDPVRDQTISVQVVCEADVSKLSIINVSAGSITESHTAFEVVDRLRGGA
jgi:Flp pilus assembly protein TadG